MIEEFENKYIDLNWNECEIEGCFGVYVKNQYRKTNLNIEVIVNNVLPQILNLINTKINSEDKVFEMRYNQHSTQNLYILKIDQCFNNPLESIHQVTSNNLSDLFESRGNIIVFELKINNIWYEIYIGDTFADILKKSGMFSLSRQPKVLEREETLVINASNLICIKDSELDCLIIKDTARSSKLFNLDKFFEMKAKELLSNSVDNANELTLTKDNIKRILNNSECYSLEYINNNKDNFIEVMKNQNIAYIQADDGTLLVDDSNPKILLRSAEEINEYISGLNKVIEINPISKEEKEVIK